MDYNRSPEDNTFVVKSMKELNRFLGRPQQPHQRLSFSYGDRTKDSFNSSRQDSSNLSLQQNNDNLLGSCSKRKRSMDAEYATLSRDERAELIAAKSKILKLQEDISSIQSEQKVKEIVFEKDCRLRSSKILKEQENCDTMRRK